MQKILVNTHKESNVNLLKARDFYFDQARIYNNRYRQLCVVIPIVVSVLSMLICAGLRAFHMDGKAEILESAIDLIVGVLAILVFIVDMGLQNAIDDRLKKSNFLREEYDCRVLGIDRNPYFYHFSETETEEFLEKAKFVQDDPKYEVWYREIFSEDDFSNAICCMLDNVIYTFYVYRENMKSKKKILLYTVLLFILYCILYFNKETSFAIVNPFIFFLAIFDYVKEIINDYFVSKGLMEDNKDLKNTIISQKKSHYFDNKDKQLMLRCIQDVVIDNREKSLFISKKIRKKYLKNDSSNEYYRELDEVKNLFWEDLKIEKPAKAEDFQICTVEDENKVINLQTVHEELLGILGDIKDCLDKNGFSFMLDGGTLIGSCREENDHRFLDWDDDVDIAVKSSEADKIFEILKAELGEKYDVQDYNSERYYSPRLSRMRVRQKNSVSKIEEKDSELFELYEARGLFIDIYAYCPILVNRSVDALYRRIWIHPLYKKIRKVESRWKHRERKEYDLKKFEKLKKKYMDRSAWYKEHAKNEDYYVYEPHYIDDLKTPGPYIRSEDIYGISCQILFEGDRYEVPSNPDAVLSAYYKKDWHKAPIKSLEDLRYRDSQEGVKFNFSKEEFDASCYKHVKKVSIYGKETSAE